MKILITNHHLNNFAGSELFTLNLAISLKRSGDEIFVFAPIHGNVSEELVSAGINFTNNLLDFKDEKFDIIHAQHNTTAILARSIFPRSPMIFMVHGITPELEQPPSIELGISKYITVSEEIREYLVLKYLIDKNNIEIIRNFIDMQKFFETKPVSKKLSHVLVISNHFTDEAKSVIKKACSDLKISFNHVGFPEKIVRDVEVYINNADLVVTLGRGVLESMACGRNVIVYDMHGGDGFVDEKNYYDIRKNNFSGRKYGKKYSVDDFKWELLKYDPTLGKKLKEIIEKENSECVIIEKIKNIYEDCKNSSSFDLSLVGPGQLYNEINFLEKLARENDVIQNKFFNVNLLIEQKKQEIEKNKAGIELKEQDLKRVEEILKQKDQEIGLMRLSKFWRLRNLYIKIKDIFK